MSLITDLPQMLSNALELNSVYAARLLLTACIMLSAGLAMAAARFQVGATYITLFVLLGALTAIGWADPTFLVAAIIIVVAFFGREISGWISGHVP